MTDTPSLRLRHGLDSTDSTIHSFPTKSALQAWLNQDRSHRSAQTAEQLRLMGVDLYAKQPSHPGEPADDDTASRRDRFIASVAERWGMTPTQLLEGYEVLPCNCRATTCRGWKLKVR